MRFTLYGEAEGVLGRSDAAYWATAANGFVTDASVSSRKQGVVPGLPVKAAKSLMTDLVVEEEPDEPPAAMQNIWKTLWAASPWLETIGKRAFLLQVPGNAPPLREVRNLLLSVEAVLSPEQRIRSGLAENPFLARALVEWSRLERIPQALYYKVGRQQWVLSPTLAKWVTGGRSFAGPYGTWVRDLPIAALWTLPKPTLTALQKLGISRLGQLEEIPRQQLLLHFGKEALLWCRLLQQEPGGVVSNNYPPLQRRKTWQAPLGEEAAISRFEELLQNMTADLSLDLHKAGCGALKVQMEWESDTADGRFERVAKKPVSSGDALQAVLWPGMDSVRGTLLRRLEVSVEDIRPLQSIQSSFVIQGGMFVTAEEISQKDVTRLLYHVNRKFPKGLQVGLRPTFRELRLSVLEDALRESPKRAT